MKTDNDSLRDFCDSDGKCCKPDRVFSEINKLPWLHPANNACGVTKTLQSG